jgi:multiple sugar transport system substrate-binding protein
MRKTLLLIGVVLLITASAAGAQSGDQISLKMWNTAEALANPLTQAYLADFQKKNPNVKVEFTVFPWTELRTKLLAAFAANQGPDQFQSDSPWLLEFEAAGLLDKAPSGVVKDLNDNFLPIAKSLVATDKGVYGYPWWCFVDMLWKNVALFKKAGIDPNTPIKTWSEMLDVGKKLVVKDASGKITQAGLGFETRLLFFTDFLYNNNTSVVGEDSSGIPRKPIKSALGSKEAGEAFKWVYDAYNTYHVADSGIGWFGESFVQGKIAMVYGANWMYGWFKDVNPKGEVVIQPLPTSRGQDPQHRCDGWIQVVNAKSSAKAKEYSWKFLQEYVSKSGMDMAEKAFAIPVRKDVFTDARFKKLDPVWQKYATVLRDYKVSRIKPVVEGWDEMNVGVDPLLTQMYGGQIDWSAAQKQADGIVSQVLSDKY